jgi:3,4-dihydroxy 2-butanone 4-phosphate synthase/GTP cyclohydrolase II
MVSVADFPSLNGKYKIIAFTNNKDKKDHIAVAKGDIVGQEDVLTRLHSACITGDAFGSMRCDCGPQLRKSLTMMEKEGIVLLLYMQHEGREIGLTNKLKAYMIQDRGVDTYDANLLLGFKPDERDYETSAAMIKKLKVQSIRLLTNNPEKIGELRNVGVKITKRVPLEITPNEYNRWYLEIKRDKFGHLLSL